ncbi:AraC-like DNA-binding protein [Ruminiclostridium sufflavum DSM 19573]|uniref:AraC-like DNA-binding protein n=1 Tax=Ruminiclostridium sufflavum DSM 19573 TaxID=1121337 RepID=A0A318XXZ8_9FIRM|nr:AraC family transcriptional regulator [Ruminiclostridium sufflavum]PYG87657.1 AraC-like DNA-binding protein [Ruminiclostridium sufflavum DSM 19573]
MEKDNCDYVKIKDINQIIKKYYDEKHRELTLFEAVLILKENGRTSAYMPPPDFLGWNLDDIEELCRLIDDIPVNITYLLPPEAKKNIYHVPMQFSAMVFRENCYHSEKYYTGNVYAITYVLKGSVKLTIDDEQYELKERHLLLTLPGRNYCSYHTDADVILMVSIDESLFQKAFFGLLKHNSVLSLFLHKSFDNKEQNYLMCSVQKDRDLRFIFQHLFHEFISGDTYSEDVFCSYIQILCTYIIRGIESSDCVLPKKKKPFYGIFPEIYKYIQIYWNSLTLEQLAQEFHYERSYLGKCLSEVTGKTFSEIVSCIKLDKAKTYLTETNLRIEEIAVLSGYSSSDYFSHSFRKEVGMSPRKYRKEKQNMALNYMAK